MANISALAQTDVTESLRRGTAACHLGAFNNLFHFLSLWQAVCESLKACPNGKIINPKRVPAVYLSPGNVPTRNGARGLTREGEAELVLRIQETVERQV